MAQNNISVSVRVNGALSTIAGLPEELRFSASDLRELFQLLCADFPDASSYLITATGAVQRFVAVFVDGVDYRSLEGIDTRLVSGSRVSLSTAVSGG